MNILNKQRLVTSLLLIIIIPAGIYTKFYSGPAQHWVSDSFGGLLYEIFWCLVFYFLFPKSKPFIVALMVFVVTCILEFLQLWHPAFLEMLRRNFFGRTILGNSFNWYDFPYYFIGSAVGYAVLYWISKLKDK